MVAGWTHGIPCLASFVLDACVIRKPGSGDVADLDFRGLANLQSEQISATAADRGDRWMDEALEREVGVNRSPTTIPNAKGLELWWSGRWENGNRRLR